jgi:S-formylglutathione hydrolase FrmB
VRVALIRCDFFAETLGLSTSMTVILPQRTTEQIGMTGAGGDGPAPVLYLLHGLSDDDTIWLRRTSVERYAAPLGLAVVMPQVQRSFYSDEVHGNRYWQFVSEELPELVRSFFRVSDRREDTFVAGLSMGGYGALKLALRHPDRFAAAACLSGGLDLAGIGRRRPEVLANVFGDRSPAGTPDDPFWLLERAEPAALPALYVACGQDDPLYDANVRFRDAAQARGLAVASSFGPGEHEWGYWDARIQDVLAWLPLAGRAPATA